jgi:hypothetical protein
MWFCHICCLVEVVSRFGPIVSRMPVFCQVSVLFSRPSGYRIVAIYERVSSFSSENFSDLAAMPTGMSEIF